MGKYYFLASVLPAMPAVLGDKPAIPFVEFAGIIKRNIEPEDAPLVKALLMVIDVSNFETIHHGRDVFTEGGTLTRDEIEHARNLPLFMRDFLDEKERGVRRPYIFDSLWERYYEYVYSLGQEMECRFLVGYIAWEISLRNHLIALRVADGTREPGDYTILPHIGGQDLSSVLTQLKSQRNPLMAERILDEERLRQFFHFEGSDPFSVDTILAALERARIYERWERMNEPFGVEDFIERRGIW